MAWIIGVVWGCVSLLGFLYGFTQKTRCSVLEEKFLAEVDVAIQLEETGRDKDELIKHLIEERDQLEEQLQKALNEQDKIQREVRT